jgi:hypothetical protein
MPSISGIPEVQAEHDRCYFLKMLSRNFVSSAHDSLSELVFFPVLVGVGVGEAVHRAGVGDELIIGPCVFHFLLERLDLLGCGELVVGAVQHEDPGLDHARLGRSHRREAAVEARNPFEINPLARHVEDDAPSETVTDRGDPFGVNGLLFLQEVQRCHEAGLCRIKVLHELGGKLACIIGVHRLLSSPVHVDGKRRVSHRRKHPCTFSRIVVEPPPFVHDEDPRPLAGDALVKGEIPFHRDAVSAVAHRLAFYHWFCRGKIRVGRHE